MNISRSNGRQFHAAISDPWKRCFVSDANRQKRKSLDPTISWLAERQSLLARARKRPIIRCLWTLFREKRIALFKRRGKWFGDFFHVLCFIRELCVSLLSRCLDRIPRKHSTTVNVWKREKTFGKVERNFIEFGELLNNTTLDSIGFEDRGRCLKPLELLNRSRVSRKYFPWRSSVHSYAQWYATLEARSCVATIKREQKFSPSDFESAAVTGSFRPEVDCCVAGNVLVARYFPPISPISSVYLNKFYRSSIVLITPTITLFLFNLQAAHFSYCTKQRTAMFYILFLVLWLYYTNFSDLFFYSNFYDRKLIRNIQPTRRKLDPLTIFHDCKTM